MAQAPALTEEKGLAVFKGMRDVLSSFPSDRFIQLLPTSAQEVSDLYRPAVTVVKVDPEDQRDVYPTPGGGGTLCLHSAALERIANAAGIDFDPTLTRHVHDRVRQPFICEIHVGGWYTDSLGQRRPITAGAVSDLRDGTPTAKVLKGGLDTARQFICERTESRARNRAIRKTTNLPSSFRKDELRKPMVAVRFRLDERDPEARKALIAQGTRATTEVFGTAGDTIDAGVARPEEEIIEGEAHEIGEGSSESAAPAAPAERGGPTAEVPGAKPGPRSAEAEPAVPDEPELVTDVAAIAAEVRAKADAAGNDRLQFATKEQLVDLGKGLTELLGLKGKLSDQQRVELRLAVLRAFLGPELPSSSQANRAAVSVLIAMLGDEEGRRRIGLVAAAAKAVPS